MLVYPDTADTEAERRDVQAAAPAIGQQLIVLDVRNDRTGPALDESCKGVLDVAMLPCSRSWISSYLMQSATA
jgi:hypothetical protein